MLNKIFLETDGLVVGGTQLTTTGGSVGVANNMYVGGNTITGNLTVTGTFSYPAATNNIPVFRAFPSIFTNIPDVTITQVALDKIEFDSNNCYNPTNVGKILNGIYTPPWSWAPNVPGYYQVNATVAASSGLNGSVYFVYIYKKNQIVGLTKNNFPTSGAPSNQVSTVVFMDGKTDYLSVYAYHNTGSVIGVGPVGIGTNSSEYSFNGCLIRPA